ncbi:MAG: DegV family protein [Anaerolineae bacterium]
MIAIVTDSATDIPSDLAAEHAIHVVPALINIGQQSYRDGIDMTREHFYEWLPHMPGHPLTSAPSPAAFMETYEEALKHAGQVISVHISSKLSGIYNAARLAAEEFRGRIHVIDTAQLSMAAGWVALAASQAVRKGETLEGVLHSIQDVMSRVRLYAVLNTTEYLARSGRINMVQAGLTTIFNIKPIIEVRDGMIAGLDRIRTWSRAVDRLSERVRDLAPLDRLAVMHANTRDAATEFVTRFKDILPGGGPAVISDVTPAIGVHAGPGALGVAALLARS